MPKPDTARVDLRRTPAFAGDVPFELERGRFPWPSEGDELIRDGLEGEHSIYPVSEAWNENVLAQLAFFANQYRDAARTLVDDWLSTGCEQPENIAYVVAFLYRHAIELEMKAIISRQEWFHAKSAQRQNEILRTHSLHKLWGKVRRSVAEYYEETELGTVERLILQLHRLDKESDGFRYPFGFKSENRRLEIVSALGYEIGHASFENLVERLEALNDWLEVTEDVQDEHQRFAEEQRRDFEHEMRDELLEQTREFENEMANELATD